MHEGTNGLERIAATGTTPDEVIEAHNPRVYVWSRMPEALTCVRS